MRHSLATLLLVLAACQGSQPDVDLPAADSPADSPSAAAPTRSDSASAQTQTSIELRTDQSRYRAGGAVALTIVNHSATRYSFNPCTRVIERESNGAWSAIPDEGRMCTMEAWVLEPNATRDATTDLPNPLPPGRYRLTIAFTADGQTPPAAATQASSPPITVEP